MEYDSLLASVSVMDKMILGLAVLIAVVMFRQFGNWIQQYSSNGRKASSSATGKRRKGQSSSTGRRKKAKNGFGKTVQGPLSDVDRLYEIIPGIRELVQSGGTQYSKCQIPKRTGGFRDLHVPDEATKKVQRALYHKVFSKYRVHEAACGFVKGRSIVQNASSHLGQEVVVKLDIREFFPNTYRMRINKYFRSTGWTGKAADLLTSIVCYKQGLPQGAPTSPVISNIVNKTMDWRFAALAETFGAQYTRYADDITLSFKRYDRAKIHRLIHHAGVICRSYGYKLNNKKKRIIRSHRRQEVTGLVVNEKVNLPRPRRRWLRSIQHRLRNGKQATVTTSEYEGWMSLLKMVNPESALLASHQQLILDGILNRKENALPAAKQVAPTPEGVPKSVPETEQDQSGGDAIQEARGQTGIGITSEANGSLLVGNGESQREERLQQQTPSEAEPESDNQAHSTVPEGVASQGDADVTPDTNSELFYDDRLIDLVQKLKNAKPYSAEAKEVENLFNGRKYDTVIELESYKRTFSFKLPDGFQKGRTVTGSISDGTEIQLYFADQLSSRIEAADFPLKGEVSIEVIQWNSTFKRIEALATGGLFD